jgi:hypothetical protein
MNQLVTDVARIRAFEGLQFQFVALKAVLDALSEKEPTSPHLPLGAFKVGVVEALLKKAVDFFGDEQPLDGLASLAGDNPSISDAGLVVAQYLAALGAYRAARVIRRHGKWFWVVAGPPDQQEQEVHYVPVVKHDSLDNDSPPASEEG